MSRFLIPTVLVLTHLTGFTAAKPNILWIYAEDTSPWMGCYGDSINAEATPNIDALAEAGIMFTRAYVPAPVCSATRSAMIVGRNAIRFGAHEHRSSRGGPKIHLPAGYQLLPQIMQAHGYTTFNNGKTDYNFVWDSRVYNFKSTSQTDFQALISKQPFFGQIQTKGGKNNTWKFPANRKVNPKDVTVPSDYPDNQIYREVVAQHYDAIRMDDDLIGEILRGLEVAGLAKNTIVVYFSDHGANNLLRHKQMATEGGLHVPFIVMGPERYVPKSQVQVRNDLVDMLDLSATTLAWAGIDQPEWYEGHNLFAEDFKPRSFVASQKDRLDHTIDRVRTIRTDQFRYVRNYKLDRIFLQPQYRDRQNYTKNLHQLYRDGKLSARHEEIYFGERPAEELYDVSIDPEMMHDLVSDPAYKAVLNEHRALLDSWLALGDLGEGEEPTEALKANGEGTKWGEGVNVEYEAYRVDSDGDGLSDKWEVLNQRSPNDGRLYFDFECGGWQTEGWFSKDMTANLAGSLGYLDFVLDAKSGMIQREGLNVIASKKDKFLMLQARVNAEIECYASANGQVVGHVCIAPSGAFKSYLIQLVPERWRASIYTLELRFEGLAGTVIEIDAIEIQR